MLGFDLSGPVYAQALAADAGWPVPSNRTGRPPNPELAMAPRPRATAPASRAGGGRRGMTADLTSVSREWPRYDR